MTKRDGRYVETSWAECRRAVEEIASGLISLGVGSEERVAILASTRPEWLEADFASLAIGCVTIPIYPSSLPAECGYILVDSGARTVFAENVDHARKIRAAVDHGVDVEGTHHAVQVDNVILIDGRAEGCLGLDELRERGRASLEENRQVIERRTATIHSEQLATIVYTSGTTGLPKGVMQSHGNHLAALVAVERLAIVESGQVDFSFLPFAHSFGRMMEYMGVYLGTVTAFAERIETITEDLALSRPHFLPSVPRIYEKIYAAVQQARAASGPLRRGIFDWAIAVGSERAKYVNLGEPIPPRVALFDQLARRLVFDKIHSRVGGRMRYLISGGAPLATEINAFFHAVGLPVLEGYGLTETTPILTCNRPGRTRIGTVGVAIDDVTLKIAADGEILAKGPNVAYGYHRRPDETAEAWDQDGWFHTGDIGEIEHGFLRITDRKKELIKTAGGKYVAPQKIENLLKSRPLISQAVVIGDRLKYCVALLTLDPDAARAWARSQPGKEEQSVEELAHDDALKAAIQAQVDAVNENLASFETIKRFHLLANDFTIETGELTPSLKIKRKVIADKYADQISSLVDA